jgi:small GTP-binding protein
MENKLNYKRIGKKLEKEVKSIFQILMLGDCEVGKTCLIKRILYNEFNEEYNKTISFEFNWNNFEIENEIYTLQIWDITGKKNFNLISENFYKKCKCAFFIYSIDDKKSFLSLNERLNVFRNFSNENTLLFLIGNKNDKSDKREIEYFEGNKFKNENNLDYFFEISCKNNDGIEHILEMLFISIISQLNFNDNFFDDQSELSRKLKESVNFSNFNKKNEKNFCHKICNCVCF